MGNYYRISSGEIIEGLGILPFHTIFKADKRMIGDTKYVTEWGEVRAFENHSGQTYFEDNDMIQPLGKVLEGFGNNPQEKSEGIRYKNLIGSYSHGPLLKNLNIADGIVKLIIERYQRRINKITV